MKLAAEIGWLQVQVTDNVAHKVRVEGGPTCIRNALPTVVQAGPKWWPLAVLIEGKGVEIYSQWVPLLF